MSSDLQSTLELLPRDNYLSLVAATAVVYDYFLTFSSEIHYVWCRPWTRVSTMFLLVRYVGLSWTILFALDGTTFIPGPVEVSTTIMWVIEWTFVIFLNTADLVMVLRVYAMWNRSKWILWLLLSIYVPQVILSLIVAGVYNTNTYISVTIVQVTDFSFCSLSSGTAPFMLAVYANLIPRFVLGAMLLILAGTQTLKQSINMYKATKQWQPNRYMERLVRDGMIYFLVNMFFNISALVEARATGGGTWVLLLGMLSDITLCPMMPRFIISVRELYDRDLRRGWQGVDTGFGVLSLPITSQNAAVSAIAFADVASGQDQAVEEDMNESEAIRLVELSGDNMHHV